MVVSWIAVGIKIIQGIVFVYDLVTYPVYWLIQRPDKVKDRSSRKKAVQVSQSDDSVIFKSNAEVSELYTQFQREKIDTLDKVFKHAVAQNGHRDALGTREIIAEEDEAQPNGRIFKKFVLGDYQWLTFLEVDNKIEDFGRGLAELGATSKQNIVLFSETRAEWMMAAFGCLRRGMTCVTLYANLGDEAIVHGINETDAEIIITSNELLPKFKQILKSTPKVKCVISFESQLKPLELKGFKGGVAMHTFSDVLKLGSKSMKVATPPKADDIAIIMYTSGSTGTPKGVMMSHKNIVASLAAYTTVLFELYNTDVYMAFLPLAHVLELIAELMCMLYGIKIGYSSALTMTDTSGKIKRGAKGDATVLKPTLIASVPLILDRIYKNVVEKVEKSGPFTSQLFDFVMKYKEAWYERGFDTPLWNRTLFKPIRGLLGGRVRVILSGGAPLAPENHSFVRNALCAPILQGYGLTETSSGACITDYFDRSVGRVGGPLVCCDIKLVSWEEGNYRVVDSPRPRGEIHIGGDNVAVGYYRQESKTKEDFYDENGTRWFKTGDIAVAHDDGSFQIVDRKKDLVKLQAGEYISLGKVESELKTCPVVDNICVHADSRHNYAVAIICPSAAKLKEMAEKRQNGVSTYPFEKLCKDKSIEKEVLQELQEFAKKRNLEKFEIPQAVRLCSEAWTPDSGLVTAAFKLKRKNIEDAYRHHIIDMYKR